GRTLATSAFDYTLRLWEVASGMERGRIPGHQGYVSSVAFSRDGRLLAAASSDAPVYIWDVYRPSGRAVTETFKDDRDKPWQQLAAFDASIAFRAVCNVIALSDQGVALLEEGWKRLRRSTPEQMTDWIKDLDNGDFRVRQNASSELGKSSTGYEELLRQA